MIRYVYGDLFYSPARVLVNPVNTVGAMGSGLAYDFKRFFSPMYELYRDACQQDRFSVGDLMLYKGLHKWVLNFPIKTHFRAAATLETIEVGLQKFAQVYADYSIESISFPALGLQEDRLDWDEVRPRMESTLGRLPISIFIHRYDEAKASQQRNIRTMRKWLNQLPTVVSFQRFWQELGRALQERDGELRTLEDKGERFRVRLTQPSGRQPCSIKITPGRGTSLFLPETQLLDLWQYVRRAGYIMPGNLPGGLDQHAPYIVALLATLPFVHSLDMAETEEERVRGLHYIPPLARQEHVQSADLNPKGTS